MTNTLIIFSTQFGQTKKISDRIQAHLESVGEAVTSVPLEEAPESLAGFDKVLLCSSIYHGKHRPEFYQYIADHKAELDTKANAFFSINLVARKPHKNTPETNPYVKQFLAKTPWKPKLMAVFGGVIDYRRYNTFDRYAIRFIMWLTKGPRDLNEVIEYTQWDRVDAFARDLAELKA